MTETENGQRAEPPAEDPTPPFSSGYESDEVSGVQHPEMSQDARNMAMLCHILGFLGFIGPLVIWLIERDKHRFVDEHGREAMNYQISMMIYGAAVWLSCLILIGIVLTPALMITHIVLVIIGAVKAQHGQPWRYPIAISFLK